MIDVAQLASQIKLQREHQMRAVRAALEALLVRGQRGVVLADEVGCGKTYEALGTAALLWKHFKDTSTPVRRVLVVAEPALLNKWFDELEAAPGGAPGQSRGFQQYVATEPWKGFQDMLRNVTQIGSRWNEGSGVRENGKYQVPPDRVYVVKPLLLTSGRIADGSPIVRWLAQTDWDVIITDEAHHFTNLRTERSRVFFPAQTIESRADGLTGRFLLALTATPFQLATTEILNLLRLVQASPDDVTCLERGLERFEWALEQFYARRGLAPTDAGRSRWVERLAKLRTEDASDGEIPSTPGLEALLRRYLIRNVKENSERDYAVIERRDDAHHTRPFAKLDDLRPLVASSPLIGLHGNDALVYLELRDVLVDAERASRTAEPSTGERERPSFVAGDLRQCLSSYHQLAESAVLAKKLPRAERLRARIEDLTKSGHRHPKITAICAVVDRLLDAEIDSIREDPSCGFHKILVFNSLMQTAGALRGALLDTVRAKVEPFVDERVRAAGFEDQAAARAAVRRALRAEREVAREKLVGEFPRDFLSVPRELLEETGLEMKGDSRELVDIMFDRAEEHCSQPLFLLRMANRFIAFGDTPDDDSVQMHVMRRVGDPLLRSLRSIVDDYLDDTPKQGEAFSKDNLERARREIARLARILAAPKYVGRFDGSQNNAKREMRRESFNRPYAPLVLLVSRVGEEGIDLQQHTKYVLHYDVEWNPAKMEQREGRVDREGRRSHGAVQVHFFLLKDTYEERVFHTVMQRDAWFQVLIGSKKKELAKGVDEDPETVGDAVIELELGRLTAEERKRVMIDLRP